MVKIGREVVVDLPTAAQQNGWSVPVVKRLLRCRPDLECQIARFGGRRALTPANIAAIGKALQDLAAA
jgi:hypothetical protein